MMTDGNAPYKPFTTCISLFESMSRHSLILLRKTDALSFVHSISPPTLHAFQAAVAAFASAADSQSYFGASLEYAGLTGIRGGDAHQNRGGGGPSSHSARVPLSGVAVASSALGFLLEAPAATLDLSMRFTGDVGAFVFGSSGEDAREASI